MRCRPRIGESAYHVGIRHEGLSQCSERFAGCGPRATPGTEISEGHVG